MTQINNWIKDFRGEFINRKWWRTSDDHPFGLDASPQRVLKYFKEVLANKITLAKAEERQRILKLIKKYSPTCGGGKCYVVEELINKIK